MSDIFTRVQKVIVEQMAVEPEKVTREAMFDKDLGGDSLDTVEIVMSMEDEFGVEIPDDAAAELTTVGKLVDFIEKISA